MADKILQLTELKTSFTTPHGEVNALNGITFGLKKGEVLGIVGESGSGKSVTAYSILQILASNGEIKNGSIDFDGEELTSYSQKEMLKVRGNKISIIFQDPMTSLNPVYTVENQIVEVLKLHVDKYKSNKNAGRTGEDKISKQELNKRRRDRAIELLELVGINDTESRLKQYPHELSGGMRQRVMIAMALACEPDILVADEPTTALDVTIQAQILELMQSLQKKFGMAIIMITHDLGVIAGMCDKVIVMYGGRIVERGTTDQIFYDPRHEYTKGLMASIPKITTDKNNKLQPIEGTPIDLLNMPNGCSFSPRCKNCMKICLSKYPEMRDFGDGHFASCFMSDFYEKYGKDAVPKLNEEDVK